MGQTEKAKKRAMIRLRKIYNADMMTEQDFKKYEESVLTQKHQLDALDTQKQKMMKEDAFYRSSALLKYAILNKAARLNATSDTLLEFRKPETAENPTAQNTLE